MNIKISVLLTLSSFLLFSCVSNKKFQAEQVRYVTLNSSYDSLKRELKSCEDKNNEFARNKALLQAEITNLTNQIGFLKENNTTVLQQLQNLSVLSGTQAESVKKSLDNLGAKDAYIKDLQSALSRKDSLNMVLVMNLKGALNDINDKDVEIKVEKGVVFISISDKMLFKSGSSDVSDQAKTVLGKVAQVLNANPQIDFLVEGHTDTIPIHNSCIIDNWDLSVKRATAVTRMLQNTYNISPVRMTAGGRSEYAPLVANATADGRSVNRRTRIVIQPQLDQFFQLLEKKE